MRKRIGILAIVLLLVSNLFLVPAVGAFAADNSQVEAEVNAEEMVNSMENYVYAENNTLKVKGIPESVYTKFGRENIEAMLDGIEEINEMAAADELIVTDNKTIYETNDTEFNVQGGVNKVVYKWYGRVRYFSTASAKDFVYASYKVAAGAAGAGTLAAFFSAGTTALFGGLTAWYYTNLALDVDHANSGHKRGVIVSVTWASVYWVSKQ